MAKKHTKKSERSSSINNTHKQWVNSECGVAANEKSLLIFRNGIIHWKNHFKPKRFNRSRK